MRTVRVFLSSPADVDPERQRLRRLIGRLNGEMSSVVRFEAIAWETRFYAADKSFQEGIPEASDCDLVIAIFWSRLGTALSASFATLPADLAIEPGERFPSGSAYELLSALFPHARRTAAGPPSRPNPPQVYVFRKSGAQSLDLGDSTAVDDARTQWMNLETFWRRWFRQADGTVLRSHYAFRSTDEVEEQCEKILRDWVRENVPGAAKVVWSIGDAGSPFRGLAPFEARHASVFFGRERKIARAIELIKDARDEGVTGSHSVGPRGRRAKPILMIVGRSGAGKSSLMRAGVAPRLTAPGVVDGVDVWRTAIMQPDGGTSLPHALAEALTASDGETLRELIHRVDVAELTRLFTQTPEVAIAHVSAALDAVAAAAAHAGGYERPLVAHLLLQVDQLEDVFQAGTTPNDRAAFARLLSDLAATGRVWIVTTLRGDQYERLISDRAWIALKDAGATYDLAPPGPEEIEEIVRESAAAAGLVYERDPATGVGLDGVLRADATGEDILPLLQFTLERLFEKREDRDGVPTLTLKAYREMGGLDGAIDQAADEAIAKLDPRAQDSLPQLLRQLAVPLDMQGRESGRLALAARSVPFDRAQFGGALTRLVDALIAKRILLVTKAEQDDQPMLRVAHQRVFESWERAREIVEREQDFYRVRGVVERQHARWLEGGRQSDHLLRGNDAYSAIGISRRFGRDLSRDLHEFIGRSHRRARWRSHAINAAAVGFALLALAAAQSALNANLERRRAVDTYQTARGTVEQLIASFTGRLADMEAVPVDTIETAFNEIKGAVDRLGSEAAAIDPKFDATRAGLNLGFARTYKRSDADRGLALAEDGVRTLEALTRVHAADLDLEWRLSLLHEVISDLLRPRRDRRPDALAAAERAHAIRARLVAIRPDNEPWAEGLSQILVRVGDAEWELGDNQRDMAKVARFYESAADLSLAWHFKPDADRALWQRELSWSINKLARLRSEAARGLPRHLARPHLEEALILNASELCLRRRIRADAPGNAKFQIDVSWSLDRLAAAREALLPVAWATIETELLEAMVLRAMHYRPDDPRNNEPLLNLYRIMTRYGDVKLKRGQADLALAYFLEAEALQRQIAIREVKQDGLPPLAPRLTEARRLLGEDRSAEVLASAPALRQQEQRERTASLRVRPPQWQECWAEMEASLQRLAQLRLLGRSPQE